jgi:hypothetical protein
VGEAKVADDESNVLKALKAADMSKVLPPLRAEAYRRLRHAGMAEGRKTEPSTVSVEQLVAFAIERAIDSRTWDPSRVDFIGFLRGVVKSLAWSEVKRVLRAKTYASADLEGYMTVAEMVAKSPEDEAIAEENRQEFFADVAACAAGDDHLELLLLAVLDVDVGIKRAEIAAALGWDEDQVSAARVKLQRRLLKESPARFHAVRERRRKGPA